MRAIELGACGHAPCSRLGQPSRQAGIRYTEHPTLPEQLPLAKPNYSFEKRQREIAAKKQKDEKMAKKKEAREAAKAATHPAGERTPSEG